MNRLHNLICSSGWWARSVERSSPADTAGTGRGEMIRRFQMLVVSHL
ncbi:MAG TPA: hypothetical protein VGL78_12015 [Solirubrobacteraceae bacterium]|jgi:hypothetical protein